ncbi:ABC transporter permease [Nonomuraea soli]|uniref:Glycine betaine/proline transport system permease protein n=1 Tax=Nonomuraea soli TaxID=1032476 RepID=A0A7W0HRW4_9ACTN|nr:ABC transporter permease subunit [Nonomuraea soli]MBA2893242.1 glycine betaine/proline transport system permease protein [Nonomuraea soli]
MAAEPGLAPPPAFRLPRWAAPAAFTLVLVLAYLLLRGSGTLPHDDDAPQFTAITELREWVDAHKNDSPLFLYFVNYVRLFIGGLFALLQTSLHGLGWPGLIGVMGALGWLAGGWRTGLLAMASLAACGVLGVWTLTVDTLALVGASVLLSLAIGLPLGVWAGRSPRLRRALGPVLDFMQIMPTFAYLAPMVLFFQIGAPAGVAATMIYSIPPAIRITALAIEQVSPTAVEASASLGATPRQTLTKVYLPLARSTMGLAINQTIMMALSMVVIANLINSPGLGSDIIKGLSRENVGLMLPAGLAIVLIGIALDRTTMAASRQRFRPSRVPYAVAAGLAGAGLTFVLPAEWPWVLRTAQPVNEAVRWAERSWFEVTDAIKEAVSLFLLNPLEGVLTSAPWWLVALALLALAWRIGGVRPAVTVAVCVAAIVLLALWEHSMVTLAMVIVAVAATLAIGVSLGILGARSARFSAFQRPLLDAAQTLPAFVYLLPALALFGATRFTAIFASVIYAVPPVVRLVEEGIRNVPPTVVEAALSAGSTPRQMLWKVQLPMARKAILLAANQGIVMTLAMVVLGALVGGGALGYDVVSGFSQRTDFGMGFAAGVAIVLLGIMLDRITQGADRRPPPLRRKSL